MFSIYDWDSIYEYFYEQAMNDIKDEDYAHAYITHQSKEIGDEKMTRQQRKKQLKNNIELTIIYIMYLYMVMMIGIKLLE